jgi:hypothetical protein
MIDTETYLLLSGDAPSAPSGDLTSWPRRGASLYSLVTDSAWDYVAFADILADCGMNLTRCCALTADWIEQRADIVWPFKKLSDGRWDLFDWQPAYFDRLTRVVAAMNARGILVQLDLMELYGWSDRKQGLPGVPDANAGPWRANVNGIHWADDRMFDVLPDAWLNTFIDLVTDAVTGTGTVLEVGNEMPERGLHYRIRDRIRQTWPDAPITVNRNEDVPGQYQNMRIGADFDRISFHGKRDLGTLDEWYDNGGATGRPDTFRKLLDWPGIDCSRIIFSSDGCRISTDPVNTYDWDRLFEVIAYVVGKGCGYEMQSRAKMTRIQTGKADLSMVEVEFLRKIVAL